MRLGDVQSSRGGSLSVPAMMHECFLRIGCSNKTDALEERVRQRCSHARALHAVRCRPHSSSPRSCTAQ